jgi:hypothetical protein
VDKIFKFFASIIIRGDTIERDDTIEISNIIKSYIYIGTRAIVNEGSTRFKIYLPTDFNKLWKSLKKKGGKVEVLLRPVEEET